ncbi:FAD-dependent oxidoreductase [Umezawaea beigongshangensis]|uniref:FAD-dependent oxidoreductase n=1 Tax=Umezawaea beigongshangensis TaxID=2780383 RepID=UPI0018F20DD0|nr:FAD-binding monooxygenase [Umezawaea beigongshangensis]
MEETGRAVVVGAGIAGLLAARALSDVFERVAVIDRDVLTAGATGRRGVPQGPHAHALLAGGTAALEHLLPGLGDELVAGGAVRADLQHDLRWYSGDHRLRAGRPRLEGVGVSGVALERAVRDRVRALPGVTIIGACDVVGLTSAPGRDLVTGVRLLPRADSAAETRLAADLVVDAGGRASRTPAWLEEMGYQRVPEESVEIGLACVTRHYRREPHHLDGGLGAVAGFHPGTRRGGCVIAQEGDRFAVTVAGVLGEHPPGDHAGLLAFAESLPGGEVAEVVRTAQPLDDPVRMSWPRHTRRYYERVRRFPDGLLVLGDALCTFNPLHGQGASVAALEAQLLARLLAHGTDRLARRFFRAAASLVHGPWSIGRGTDLRFPELGGRRTAAARLVAAYLDRYRAAAAGDPVLGGALVRVFALTSPPARLFAPDLVARVLRHRAGSR